MKYFVYDDERKSTAYHEFYKGKWDDETFWSKDSICLHDIEFIKHKGFFRALQKVVPDYSPYDIPTEITKEIWGKVRDAIPSDDVESLELYEEADAWAKEPLETDGCFTILGI